MISEIAWENIRWIKETILDDWEFYGGKLIAVDSFRQFYKLSWLKKLKLSTAIARHLDDDPAIDQWEIEKTGKLRVVMDDAIAR